MATEVQGWIVLVDHFTPQIKNKPIREQKETTDPDLVNQLHVNKSIFYQEGAPI